MGCREGCLRVVGRVKRDMLMGHGVKRHSVLSRTSRHRTFVWSMVQVQRGLGTWSMVQVQQGLGAWKVVQVQAGWTHGTWCRSNGLGACIVVQVQHWLGVWKVVQV